MPKYDQKSTFDRKVLESPIFNQNDAIEIPKYSPIHPGSFFPQIRPWWVN